SDKTDNKKHNEKAKRDSKGKSPVDTPTAVWDLRAEFEEFSSKNTTRVNAVSAPVTAAGKSSFFDPFKYPDDPNMPELEDIFYSDDEEDVDPLGKFNEKADEGFLVGYSVNRKALGVFNSRTRIIQETLHTNFLENKPNVAGIRPKWLFDIDTLTVNSEQ
nr:retrovirus-related Pol polyprotein from transposon TNT 1-94 [Tanacetum cinerariifolium]